MHPPCRASPRGSVSEMFSFHPTSSTLMRLRHEPPICFLLTRFFRDSPPLRGDTVVCAALKNLRLIRARLETTGWFLLKTSSILTVQFITRYRVWLKQSTVFICSYSECRWGPQGFDLSPPTGACDPQGTRTSRASGSRGHLLWVPGHVGGWGGGLTSGRMWRPT